MSLSDETTSILTGTPGLWRFFLYNGINHFRKPNQLSGYTASKNVPLPHAAVIGSGAMLTFAGGSILLGLKPKYGLLSAAIFLGVVSPLMHDFWRESDPESRTGEIINFTKNMALLGASLALLQMKEPWPVSVESERPHKLQRVLRSARQLAA